MEPFNIQSLYNVNEVEISYRNMIPYPDRIQITRSATAHEILRSAWDENKLELLEQFKILLLDRKNNCLAISSIATGGIAACVVDPKVIFMTALKANASGIILAHNHPSGSLDASEQDKALTAKLVKGGKLLDIAIHDHLIVTAQSYMSFADRGLLPG